MAAAKRRRKQKPMNDARPRHGSEGLYEPVDGVVMDDPGYNPSQVEGELGNKRKISATVNRRHDIIVWLHARKDIDDAQARAGNRFLALHEQMQCGARAVDYSRVRVDGGAAWPDLDVQAMEAALELDGLRRFVGHWDCLLLERAICHRSSIHGIAMGLYGRDRETDRKYLGRRLREALDMAARHWGYAK